MLHHVSDEGASCWSDHYLVRTELSFKTSKQTSRKKSGCAGLEVLTKKLNMVDDSVRVVGLAVMKISLLTAAEKVVVYCI